MDRVSNLPDEVLCHILSFLTTKEAALTSILAKRWRYLLPFLPSLTISDSEFLHPEEDKWDRPDIKQSFKDFVDRVLCTNSPLKKFSLESISFTVADTDLLDGWISNVLARGVSDLDLRSFLIFTATIILTITFLQNALSAAHCIFLPLLKTLVLGSVSVCPNEFQTLLHSLPSLEELLLDDVKWKDMDVTVSSASVKTLKIELSNNINTLSFDTPSVLHFDYSGDVASDYPLVNMENLVDAKIYFSVLICYRDTLDYSNAWKLFHGIRNLANLDLFPDTLDVLSLCFELAPVFNNLKLLAVKSNKERGWLAILSLLRKCPHLETLVFKALVHHKCGDVCDCISREEKGFSLTVCPVKVMKIHGFQGTMQEVAMIEHFLEYFPSLKEMVVYAGENSPIQLRNREVSKLVSKIFQLFNKLSSCNVKLIMVGDMKKNKTIS